MRHTRVTVLRGATFSLSLPPSLSALVNPLFRPYTTDPTIVHPPPAYNPLTIHLQQQGGGGGGAGGGGGSHSGGDGLKLHWSLYLLT